MNQNELLMQAVRHFQSGRFADARLLCDQILAAEPDHRDALQVAGLIAVSQGRFDDGIEQLRRAAALTPGDPNHLTNLGVAFAKAERWAEAEEAYRDAIATNRAGAQTYGYLGNALLHQDKLEEAVAPYQESLRREPDMAATHVNFGTVLQKLDRKLEAVRHFQEAIRLAPSMASGYTNLCKLLRELNRPTEAYGHCLRAVELAPESVEAHTNLAAVLSDLSRAGEAAKEFEKALSIDPEHAGAWEGLGAVHQQRGAFDEATTCFRKLVDNPDRAPLAYRALTVMKRLDDNGNDIQRMRALLSSDNLSERHQGTLHYALGTIEHQSGNFDEAFAHFETANKLWSKSVPYIDDDYRRFVDAVIEVFTREFIEASAARMGTLTERSVFIVGMPRSGTTLIEQILSSHPEVYGAGELTFFNIVRQDIQRTCGSVTESAPESAKAYPRCVSKLSAEDGSRFAQAYLDLLNRLAADASRVTDKMPSNYANVGLIWSLLPRARIIHCNRNPLDSGLSCFITCFAKGNTFSCDLRDIGRMYLHSQRFMEHWRSIRPEAVLDVNYEELVADQEEQSRRLIDFIELEWDDRCLRFHETERVVKTASMSQVRRPMYSSSVDRWRCYERHLGPLQEVLEGHG